MFFLADAIIGKQRRLKYLRSFNFKSETLRRAVILS